MRSTNSSHIQISLRCPVCISYNIVVVFFNSTFFFIITLKFTWSPFPHGGLTNYTSNFNLVIPLPVCGPCKYCMSCHFISNHANFLQHPYWLFPFATTAVFSLTLNCIMFHTLVLSAGAITVFFCQSVSL